MPFAIYNTQDEVPADQRDVYEEREGKWHAKVPDVTKLNSALEAERARAEKEEKDRKAAEKERDALKRTADAKSKGITEEQLADIQAKEVAARKPLEDDLAATKAENRKLKLTDQVKVLALKAGIMPDRIAKAMKDLEERVDLTADGNSIVVKDLSGKVTAETIDDFLTKTYKVEAPFFYKGSGSSGSGAEESSGPGGNNGSYDPVAAGKAAAKEQKKTQGDNALAFK